MSANTADQKRQTINDLFLKNIDQAVCSWFNTEFPIDFEGRKTPVIYVSHERWALMQKQKGYRDENSVLILPIITVRRFEATELFSRYVPKDEQTRIKVKRDLAKEPNDTDQLIPYDPMAMDKPIYEIVTSDFPTFIKIRYSVTLHTSYLSQANQLQENIWKKFDSGRSYFKNEGYYIFAEIQGSSDESNLDDFVDNQRIIKYTYNFNIEAPLVSKDSVKIYRTFTKPQISVKEL